MDFRKNVNVVFSIVACGSFLATFSETLLNVAFTAIMADFNIDVNTVQWLATGYMLGAAVMVPVAAFAFRTINTRVLYCTAVGLLIVGSCLGALAPSFTVLLAARVVQALGTGLLLPTGMNIILCVIPRETMGRYMGLNGAMFTIGVSSSIIVSGFMLSVFTWHATLWFFALCCVLCFIGAAVVLGPIARLTRPHLDTPSVVLVSLGLMGMLYGISTIFGGQIVLALASMLGGAILVTVFVRRQFQLEEPLINLRVLGCTPFRLALIVNLCAQMTVFSLNIIIPTYMQSELGTTSLFASLSMFPAIVVNCAVAPLAGTIYDKHGIRPLLPVGCICMATFTILLGLFMATDAAWVRTLLLMPVQIGVALIVGPSQTFGLRFIQGKDNPDAAVVNSTGFQVAGCFASSIYVGIYSVAGFTPYALVCAALALVGLTLTIRMLKIEKEGAFVH